MQDIIVHPHALKHGLSVEAIEATWGNFVRRRPRGEDCWVTIGYDREGHEVELVGLSLADGSTLIIHALSPATKKMKRELGLGRSR